MIEVTPWLNGTFDATDAFGPWREAFDTELRLLDEYDDHVEQWESAYSRIYQNLTLYDQTGEAVAEFLLHIEDDKAWWRWSDEPFLPRRLKSPSGLDLCRDARRCR